MAKRSAAFLVFLAVLLFGVLSLILTYAELTVVLDPSRGAGGEQDHAKIASEWRREEEDLLRVRQITLEKRQPAAGVNVGRVLAKYDNTESSNSEEKEINPDTTAANRTLASAPTKRTVEYVTAEVERRQNEQMLYERQLAFHLNWTARVISSSHFGDVQEKLNTLAHLKSAELRLDTATKELWMYLRDQVKHINRRQSNMEEPLEGKLLASVKEQLDLLSLHTTTTQSAIDSYIKLGWRERMSTELSQLMQKRLHLLQNPKRCHRAKKLLCRISKPCGFGCQIHHVAYCFIFAYATERMLVLDSGGWRYSGKWEDVFQPLSNSCNYSENMEAEHWTHYRHLNSPQMIQVPSVENLGTDRPKFLPMAVPRDLIDRLKVFHGYPFVWFIGEFLHYLMRPSEQLKKYLDERRAHLNINHPIVGVHIRRTDKLQQEAGYHPVEEYMTQVEEWYERRRRVLGEEKERKVYLATDDKSALAEAVRAYPNYTFISDNDVSKTAGEMRTRYSEMGLFGVVLDVLMLSECDYIVCTFSSQVCRLAYELMQQHHTDASRLVYSLDDVYYYGGQQEHTLRALHHRTDQGGGKLNFTEGDLIKIAGNHHNGFSLGNKQGDAYRELFPSYKVEEEVLVADFPSYPEVM